MATATWDWEGRIGRRVRLRDLHILSAVVRWGSMAKAASHLAMSQSAVSEAIASLEDALRVRLLDRSPQGIEPTIYARALLKRGNVVFDELKQGLRISSFCRIPRQEKCELPVRTSCQHGSFRPLSSDCCANIRKSQSVPSNKISRYWNSASSMSAMSIL